MKTYAVGVDLGGTTIKAGIVDRKGIVDDQISVDSRASAGPKVVIKQITYAVQELFGKHDSRECAGIGIGAPGVVSAEEGIVKHPPNFANWIEVPLGKMVQSILGMPVFVENDANAAAMGEARSGAGMRFKDFLFVIWGSGVGGGIIVDRKIFRGPHGGAGEIGHIVIDYNGPHCNCGNRGCIESYIGQRYLSKRTREILQALPDDAPPSGIVECVEGNLDRIEPVYISKAAEQGDTVAREILREAGDLLGVALASALNILDLNIVIIGGGISAAPAFVFEAIESSLRSRVLKPHRPALRVVRAELGNTAGMIGAASLVF